MAICDCDTSAVSPGRKICRLHLCVMVVQRSFRSLGKFDREYTGTHKEIKSLPGSVQSEQRDLRSGKNRAAVMQLLQLLYTQQQLTQALQGEIVLYQIN